MRRAAARKALERASTIERETRLVELRYDGVLGLGAGQLTLAPFLTTVVGANGAGKSTVLKLLEVLVQPDVTSVLQFSAQRLRGATLSGRFKVGDSERVISRTFDERGRYRSDLHEGEAPVACRLLDLANQARIAIEWARGLGLDERLEGVSPQVLRKNPLAEICALVRRRYTSVECYEVEAPLDPSNAEAGSVMMPYFRVSTRADLRMEYGTENMGLGEAMLFVAHWHLSNQRLNELLILEEIDSHIPDFSKEALVERIADYSARTGASIAMSTHSALVASAVPAEGVRLARRTIDGVELKHDPERTETQLCLDVKGQIALLICCEDALAVMITKEIVRRYAPSATGLCEFVKCGGEAALDSLCRSFPHEAGCVSLLAVFDGDQRHANKGGRVNFCFLPSDHAPEVWALNVLSENERLAARQIHVPHSNLSAILSSLEGVDHHDRFHGLCQRLGVTQDAIISAVVTLAHNDSVAKAEMDLVASEVQRLLDRVGGEVVPPSATAVGEIDFEGVPKSGLDSDSTATIKQILTGLADSQHRGS